MDETRSAPTFSQLLHEHRQQASLTQEALAERSGLGRRTLQELESGARQPRRETLDRLIAALGISGNARLAFEQAAQPMPRYRLKLAGSPDRRCASPTNVSQARLTNLPLALTSFVGRTEEMREIPHLLTTKRLVTLTGAGGCGKTRLALEVAGGLVARYPDGVWLVELAPVYDPSLVSQTIANTLGLSERPDQPVLTLLKSYLHPRRCLLVWDNCEHLIEECAQVTASLLQTCPFLTILATSRQALHVFGEVQRHVRSLPTPDPTRLSSSPIDLDRVLAEYPAIHLFVERAQTVEPRFVLTSENLPTVAQVCWRLDGVPLAIELAAARVHALSIETIAARLDHRFQLLTTGNRVSLPRQQTLRATVDWSYDLLAETDRVLLPRLSIFAGSFTLEAAEGICAGEDLAAADILPALVRLVDQSLVEVAEGEETARYRLLETIREYARERLVTAGEVDVVRRQHCTWYLEWAKEGERHIWGAEQKIWLDRFEREHDNLRAVLQFCLENDVASGLHLASYLHRFWLDREHLGEGQRWLEELLSQRNQDLDARGLALVALGRLKVAKADHRGAVLALNEGLPLVRLQRQSRDVVYALQWMGAALASIGDIERAEAFLMESIEVAGRTGDLDLHGVSVGYLGALAFMRGDIRRASSLYLESLALSREAGGLRGVSWMQRTLAMQARMDGDRCQEAKLLRESLSLSWQIGHGVGIGAALKYLAVFAQQDHHYQRAVTMIAAASRDSLPALNPALEGTDWQESLVMCREALGDEAFAQAWAEGQAMTLEHAVGYALEEKGN